MGPQLSVSRSQGSATDLKPRQAGDVPSGGRKAEREAANQNKAARQGLAAVEQMRDEAA